MVARPVGTLSLTSVGPVTSVSDDSMVYGLTAVVLLPATILGFVATRYSWWGTIFGWFAQQSAFDLASWTVLIVAICVLSSYAFLRKAAA